MAGAPPGRNSDMDCNGVGPDVRVAIAEIKRAG